jgi:hypothetical protein
MIMNGVASPTAAAVRPSNQRLIGASENSGLIQVVTERLCGPAVCGANLAERLKYVNK